ncbi:MAG TPA: response regulator [Patescibacteria group bacterium]|nr:response regulator [Patescibacteria group bacterium]
MAPKILIIEDEPSLLKAMEEALLVHDFQVATAVDAGRGMEQVQEFKPDLILLDIILPGKNGFEILKELKSSPEYAKIPVIIMSNLGDEEEINQSMSLGAADYLVKAEYDLNEIVNRIKKYLPQSHAGIQKQD